MKTHILLVILQTITRLADSLEKKCINPVLAHNKEEIKKALAADRNAKIEGKQEAYRSAPAPL